MSIGLPPPQIDPVVPLKPATAPSPKLVMPPRPADPLDFEAMAEYTRQLPSEDGVPLETPWHRSAMNLLIDITLYHNRDRDDFFVGGNMFIYYSVEQKYSEDFRGPDFFYVEGVEGRRPRDKWAIWMEEGKYPDVIMELSSSSTEKIDRTEKKELYEKTFRTAEYYIYDPQANRLDGWRLIGAHYQKAQPNDRGWLWSNVLQLWIGNWVGEFQRIQATWPRFYDKSWQLVLHPKEAAQEEAEIARQQAQAAQQRVEQAEAEIARLKAVLAEKGIVTDSP